MSKKSSFTFVDLCSGIGGIRLGMELAQGECVYSCEKDPHATITYKANFKNNSLGDITKIVVKDLPEYDVLTAGFPCQPFSVAGKQLGFEDIRGTIFFDIARIIKESDPKGFLLENVKGLLGHDKGKTIQVIQDILTDLGYELHLNVLSPHTHANIPQNRDRLFIIGLKEEVFNFFPSKIPLTVEWRSLLEKERQDDRFYYNNSNSPSHVKIMAQVKSKDSVYQYRRYYVRENRSGVCPTLTANMGSGGHNVPLIIDNWGIRKLVPRECARFMGFPEDFILPKIGTGSGDTHLYKQIGNSVCVPLIKRIAEEMGSVL